MMLASSNFLIPNGTIIVEVVAFLLLFGAVAKWVLPPLSKMMEKRQQEIASSLLVIDEAKEKMEEARAAYEQATSKAHAEARAALEQANHLAEEIRSEARAKAQVEYDRLVNRAAEDIEAARQQAIREIRDVAAEMALDIAAKVIDAELDVSKHRRLIDEVVSAVGAKV